MSSLPHPEPEHCPGPQSEHAGKGDGCAGCPNQKICTSRVAAGLDPDIGLILENLEGVQRRILVLSGKGGVGKSTVTAMLGRCMVRAGQQVGVLDVDICGPSQARMWGVEGERVHANASGWSPIMVDETAIMSVSFLLERAEQAVIWRGPKKNGLMKQFLRDVQWDQLDTLLIDTPPGTSDEHLTLATCLAPPAITGAILVTTPQEVAWQDVRREIDFCRRVKIPILGVVENMAGFVCPSCHEPEELLPRDLDAQGRSRVERYCLSSDIAYLGSIPLDPRLGQCLDEGLDYFALHPESPVSQAYTKLVELIN